MTTKISQLTSITAANLAASSTTGIPVSANPTGTLTTYQVSTSELKTALATGNLNITGNLTVALDSSFTSNLTILGNLVVQGNTSTIGSNNVATTDNILELHVPNVANVAQPWGGDDGKDIGIRFHYYSTSDQNAALVMAHDSRYLEWFNAGSEGNTTFVGTSYGTIKSGGLILANTTVATGPSTGALQVGGGASVAGNLWVSGNLQGQNNISTTGSGTFSSLQSNGTVSIGGVATIASFNANTTGTVGSTFVVGGTATVNALNVNNATTTNTLTVNGNTTINNIYPSANSNANIGSTTYQFNTIFAKATSAQYADLAEKYLADADYAPGTVVIFGGSEEITTTSFFADTRVAGAISTEPAYVMNSASTGLEVALRGKVPLKVIGAVGKGDLLVTSDHPGYAQSVGFRKDYDPNAVFAKSLVEDRNYNERVIWAVIV